MESVQYNGFATSDDNFATSDDNSNDDHGWKEVVEYDEWREVVHRKRNQKQKPADQASNEVVSDKIVPEGNITNGNKQAEDQRQAAKLVAADVENGARAARDENVKAEETQKPKPRKKKKKNKNKKKNTKVSLSEALAKINPSHLAEFLVKQELVSACVYNRRRAYKSKLNLLFCFLLSVT